MEIRHATEKDYALYCDLVGSFDRFFAKLDPRHCRVPEAPVRTREDYEKFCKGPQNGVLIAFDDGVGVGIANYDISLPEYPMLVPRKVLFVSIVAVVEGKHRQGIGRALMAKLKEIASQEDCEDLDLVVSLKNTAALEFYRALGFTVTSQALTIRINDGSPE